MGKHNSAPPKGKPSGNGRENSGLNEPFAGTNREEDDEIRDEYTEGEDDHLAENVRLEHANRHLHKGEDVPEYKEPPDSD
jgi:hypothetical protein